MEGKNVKNALYDYVRNNNKWFYFYHNPERINELNKDLRDEKYCHDWKNHWKSKRLSSVAVIQEDLYEFFEAELDEVRLKKANSFATYALYISDNRNLAYFRDAVAKREYTADIEFTRQRDHAVHTLYNYILGWYIFEHSDLWWTFKDHFKHKLEINLDISSNEKNFYELNKFCTIGDEFEDYIGLVNEFGDVWPIASLLHDIGYILEGNLSSASSEVENERVSNGSKIIHDYFNHWFWRDIAIDFRAAKNIANSLGVMMPDFRHSRSLASLGDHLCDIGSCENIRKKLKTALVTSISNPDPLVIPPEIIPYRSIQEKYGLNREAFSLWEEHYKFFKCTKMGDILKIVHTVYKSAMWTGSDQGIRSLNHGVCSGLITLQALTFFHELFWGFYRFKWKLFAKKQNIYPSCNRVSKEMLEVFRKNITEDYVPGPIIIRGGLQPDSWFKKVLWATASSAIHDVIQLEDYEVNCTKYHPDGTHLKIGHKDDPLAFLGVLVDILQEWDRYTVSGESAFSSATLLQSHEVVLPDTDNDKTKPIVLYYPERVDIIDFPKKDFPKDIKKVLERCLSKWSLIVKVDDT